MWAGKEKEEEPRYPAYNIPKDGFQRLEILVEKDLLIIS